MECDAQGVGAIMTKKKELKQRIRARMEFTGERYSQALTAVQRGRGGPEVIEIDVPYEEFVPLGFKGAVQWWKSVGPATPERRRQFVRVLEALRADPATILVTQAAFAGGGQLSPPRASPFSGATALIEYAEQLRVGARLVSLDGRRLVIDLDGVPVLVATTRLPRAALAVMTVQQFLDLAPGLQRLVERLGADTSLAGLASAFRLKLEAPAHEALWALLALE